MKHVEKSRINFDIPAPLHRELKIQAIHLGVSVRELATKALEEKMAQLAKQEEADKIEKYHDLMEKYEKGEIETISHDEMMKKIGWDVL
jgi:hypothetical protein